MATAHPNGNTKHCGGLKNKKYRDFQITLNSEPENIDNKYSLIINYLKSLKYHYIISCCEYGKKNNRKHYHIFIQFNTPRKLSTKKLQGAHIESCKGSVESNINYIKKDGNIIDEYGTPKLNNHNCTIKELINCNDESQLLDFNIQYFNIINKIKSSDTTWISRKNNNNENIKFYLHPFENLNSTNYNIVTFNNNYFNGINKNDNSLHIIFDKKIPFNYLQIKNCPLNTKNGFIYNTFNEIHIYYNHYQLRNEFYNIIDKYRIHFENITNEINQEIIQNQLLYTSDSDEI